jgi:hypothetical protein
MMKSLNKMRLFYKKHRLSRGIYHRACLREDREFEKYFRNNSGNPIVPYTFNRIGKNEG